MNLASLGEVMIVIKPTGNGDLMAVKVYAETKRDDINAITAPGENPDQLARRLAGILRALIQGLPREVTILPDDKTEPIKTWDEVKKTVKK